MENCKRAYPIKRKLTLALSCFLALFFVIAPPNLILALQKNRITKTVNMHSLKPVTIKGLYYLPPNILILTGLAVSEADKKILTVPAVCATFSLQNLILRKGFSISSLHCLFPAVNDEILKLSKEDYAQILDFMQHLPKQDYFIFSIFGGRWQQVKKSHALSNLWLRAYLKIKGSAVYASGSIGKNSYMLKGVVTAEGINIEKLRLNNGYARGQLWGVCSAASANLRGFLLAGKSGFIKDSGYDNFFILDIDSRLKFDFPRIDIERLDFSLNNNPVRAKAKILLGKPFSCDLNLNSDFRDLETRINRTLKNITLAASLGTQEDGELKINGTLSIDFPKQEKKLLALENAQFNVEGLAFSFEKPYIFKIDATKLNCLFKTSTDFYNVNLKSLRTQIYGPPKNQKFIEFSSPFYNGSLEGLARIEWRGATRVITAFARIKDADAQELKEITAPLSKVRGKLSSQIFFANYPHLAWKGNLYIHDGILKDFDFFAWLAGLFAMPSLKEIPFRTASVDFTADKAGAGLSSIHLDADTMKIDGYFRLDEKDLVASKISLSFPKTLLQESPKFTPLLKLLRENVGSLSFIFQLSGNPKNMNFQWLRSDFKEDIQRAIPGFMERGLEKKLEGIIDNI